MSFASAKISEPVQRQIRLGIARAVGNLHAGAHGKKGALLK